MENSVGEKMDELVGSGGGGGDWGYLASEAMAVTAGFPFPCGRDVMDHTSSLFDFHAGAPFPSSSAATGVALPPGYFVHDFAAGGNNNSSNNPFDVDAPPFLQFGGPAAVGQKGVGFMAAQAGAAFGGGGMEWEDDEDEMDQQSLDDASMGAVSASLENGVTAAAGGTGGNGRGKKKGMPAKNLMAERRRRKKLNDRLYMLRSVVPKISKVTGYPPPPPIISLLIYHLQRTCLFPSILYYSILYQFSIHEVILLLVRRGVLYVIVVTAGDGEFCVMSGSIGVHLDLKISTQF